MTFSVYICFGKDQIVVERNTFQQKIKLRPLLLCFTRFVIKWCSYFINVLTIFCIVGILGTAHTIHFVRTAHTADTVQAHTVEHILCILYSTSVHTGTYCTYRKQCTPCIHCTHCTEPVGNTNSQYGIPIGNTNRDLYWLLLISIPY